MIKQACVIVVFLTVVVLAGCIPEPTPGPSPLPTPTPPQSPLVVSIPKIPEKFGGEPMEFTEMLAIAVFLSVVANRLIEALVVPVFDKYSLDKFWVIYVSWVVGAVLVWLSGVNLFAGYLPDLLVGQILTAIVAGGGANFIHDLFDNVL
jgi:hypothetical protein